MIHFAYDGSINGDWVFWYALNLARDDADKHLCVVYVDIGAAAQDHVQTKVDAFARVCAEHGVEMAFVSPPCSGTSAGHVFRALVSAVPAHSLLVCGARLKAGGQGYLAGTVSEKLLRDKTFAVMAVRVAQPGLLGAPKTFLVPAAGDVEGFLMGADILTRMVEDVQRIHVLRVMQLKRHIFTHLHNNQVERLRTKGWKSLEGLDQRLATRTGVALSKIHTNVVVSDDWAHEIIIAANRSKTQLILMEAPVKALSGDFLYGNPVEVVLRDTPCDVAIYRGV